MSGGWRAVGRGSPQERGKAVTGVEVGFREMLCVRRGSMDGMSVREMWERGLGEEGVLRAEPKASLCGMMLGCCGGFEFRARTQRARYQLRAQVCGNR